MKLIGIRTQFVGFHRWKNAPDSVAFLRDWHRHIFNVKVEFTVDHADRDREFFLTKDKVNEYISRYEGKKFEFSCEQIAQDIAVDLGANMAEVDEDGENYGIFINN